MSFFFPVLSRIRFAALPDTPEMENRLDQFLFQSRDWEDFLASFNNDVVDGDPKLGVFFKQGKTFITDGNSLPQVNFVGNPPSLLFVFSYYTATQGSSSFSFSDILPGYSRYHISSKSYDPEQSNLEDIWSSLSSLNSEKASREYIASLENKISGMQNEIDRLKSRQDPLESVLPSLSSLAGSIDLKLRSLERKIIEGDRFVPEGSIDLNDFYTKGEVDYQLSLLADRGYVDSKFSTTVKQVDFEKHLYDRENNPHHVNYSQVNAPSRDEHLSAVSRVSNLEDRMLQFEEQDYIKTLTSVGGILINKTSSGKWNIDGSSLNNSGVQLALNVASIGGETTFQLNFPPKGLLFVFLGGELLSPGTYTITGTTLVVPRPTIVDESVVCIAT